MKIFLILFGLSVALFGADAAPLINLSATQVEQPEQFVKTINIVIIITLFGASLLLMSTSFTRLIIVFGLLRQYGFTTITTKKSRYITCFNYDIFHYASIWKKFFDNGIKSYMDKNITYEVAIEKSVKPFKEFILKNTRESDLKTAFGR